MSSSLFVLRTDGSSSLLLIIKGTGLVLLILYMFITASLVSFRLVCRSTTRATHKVIMVEKQAFTTLSSSSSYHFSNEFQSILSSRRTNQKFLPLAEYPEKGQERINQAISRAVQCAITAPNHHRTEPTSYLRIDASTQTAIALTDILYQVTFRKHLKLLQQSHSSLDREDLRVTEAQRQAIKKKQKWKDTISSFIVVLVHGQSCQLDDDKNSDDTIFDLMTLQPPKTDKQLEDYASACASIQNILLSLHSEGIASKWATPTLLTRCRAFRSLIECKDHDMVVGVIMVGLPASSQEEIPTWKRRRRFNGDTFRVLV